LVSFTYAADLLVFIWNYWSFFLRKEVLIAVVDLHEQMKEKLALVQAAEQKANASISSPSSSVSPADATIPTPPPPPAPSALNTTEGASGQLLPSVLGSTMLSALEQYRQMSLQTAYLQVIERGALPVLSPIGYSRSPFHFLRTISVYLIPSPLQAPCCIPRFTQR
jgi:hypothetical protein